MQNREPTSETFEGAPRNEAVRTPVLRPLLPTADRLLPYLRRIDDSRIYSNWGPLSAELEQRLCGHLRLPAGSVVSASSGTAALVGAILGTAGRATPRRPVAIVPAFTFVATAIAAEHCGYEPYFMDVLADSWMLDADAVAGHPLLDRVGLVLPVSAFGRALPLAPWVAFQRNTSIPVVVDAAACLEALADSPDLAGQIPLALSFHATKSFASGEGGCVVCCDSTLSRRIAQALNFGFADSRESALGSTNGKMSEYHSAVGLAELDGFPDKRRQLQAVAAAYREGFCDRGLGERFYGAPDVAGCYALLDCATAELARSVHECLAASGIDCRFWYGAGLPGHPHFASSRHDALPVTERIAGAMLGLPVATDLGTETIARITSTIASSCSLSSRPISVSD